MNYPNSIWPTYELSKLKIDKSWIHAQINLQLHVALIPPMRAHKSCKLAATVNTQMADNEGVQPILSGPS